MIGLKFWKKINDTSSAPVNKDKFGEEKNMLGKFEVLRELGRGSMGVVYLGRDPNSSLDVAIKTITLANESNSEVLRDAKSQFLREAKILTWLDHPDIVTIYDVGEDHGLAFIAMEFLTGVKLTAYTKTYSLLSLPKVLDIMARVADALGYAHEQNVVHRDVKPGNIMYDPADNTVKVIDFGISMLTSHFSKKGDLVMGSPLYMSPEQVRGKQINGLSDLFSLGSSLYQLASGHLPFEGDSDFDVMHRIAKEPHTDILSVKPDLPPCVCAIIDHALAKDVEKRYQSGREMADAIRQCAATL